MGIKGGIILKILGKLLDDSDIPLDTQVLTFNAAKDKWDSQPAPGAGSGEANTSSNVGTGEGLALAKDVFDLPFKSLIVELNKIILTGNINDITFSLGSAVELNTNKDVVEWSP